MANIKVIQKNIIIKFKQARDIIIPNNVRQFFLFRLAQNWLFQGLAKTHWTELIFRIFFELMLVIVFSLIISTWSQYAIVWSVLIVHTLMWTFNGHLWALHISEKCRLVHNNPKRIVDYLYSLEKRIKNTQSVEACIIFGSLTRGQFHEYSDLDIVFSKKRGFINSMLAYCAGVRERALAFFYRIPIELYFYDSSDLANTDKGEVPLLLKDIGDKWQMKVPSSVWLSEYSLLSEGFFRT